MTALLADVRLYRARLSLRHRLSHARTDTDTLESVILRLTDQDGVEGVAEVRGNGAYATGIDTADLLTELCGPVRDVLDGVAVGDALERVDTVSRVPLVLCAVQGAVLDLQSRRSGVPARWLLSAAPADELATHIGIAFAPPMAGAAAARAAVDAGFSRLKLRVGRLRAADDVEAVQRVRDEVGADIALAVDANGAWAPAAAIRALDAMSPLGLEYVEQPTPAGDLTGLRTVREAVSLPIVADEDVTDAASVTAIAAAEAADGVHLKLEKCGTFTRLAAAVETARQAGLRVYIGQMDQGRLGCALTGQVGSALNADGYEVCGYHYVQRDIASGLTTRRGALVLPTAPGIGVTVDWDRVQSVAQS